VKQCRAHRRPNRPARIEQRLRQAVGIQPCLDILSRKIIGKQKFNAGETNPWRQRQNGRRKACSLYIMLRLAAKRSIVVSLKLPRAVSPPVRIECDWFDDRSGATSARRICLSILAVPLLPWRWRVAPTNATAWQFLPSSSSAKAAFDTELSHTTGPSRSSSTPRTLVASLLTCSATAGSPGRQ